MRLIFESLKNTLYPPVVHFGLGSATTNVCVGLYRTQSSHYLDKIYINWKLSVPRFYLCKEFYDPHITATAVDAELVQIRGYGSKR